MRVGAHDNVDAAEAPDRRVYSEVTRGISNADNRVGVTVGEARIRARERSGDGRLMMPDQHSPRTTSESASLSFFGFFDALGNRAESGRQSVHAITHTLKGTFMAEGTVKWFNASKHYGFIVPADGGKDVFLHRSVLTAANVQSIDDGTRVSFDLEQDGDRFAAVRLVVLGAGEPVS
jgi:CspA family cold shock protein